MAVIWSNKCVGEGERIYWDKYFNEAITDGRRVKKLCKTFKEMRKANPRAQFVFRMKFRR